MLPILSTNLCHQAASFQQSPAILYLKTLNSQPCGRMARADCQETGLDEGDIDPKGKSFIDQAIEKISTKSSKNLLYGTITGWISGIIVVKVGKVAAFGLGGGIILLHFASECGYINVNWERVRAACARGPDWVDRLIRFAKRNSCYSVGFAGGFFFGVASS